MALTAAERAKRYRDKIKQNPEKYEQHKKKELERLKKAQKKINELTDEEKDEKRKKWRKQKQEQKERKKALQQNTVPQITRTDLNTAPKSFSAKYRNLSRNLKTTKIKIEKYKTALNNLRKKLYREKVKYEKEIMTLKTENDKLRARQELLELSLRETYSDCKKTANKQQIKKLALKLNKGMKNDFSNKLLGLKGKIRTISKSKRMLTNKKIELEMKAFYNRDDISRSTAGKKETRTVKKEKMQIRYLVDTLRNLYQIYKNEGGKYSYTTFFRYKPFYILSPGLASRDTCMCIKHSNMEFIFIALKQKGVISYINVSDLLKNVACDTKSFRCMYNKCNECKSSVEYSGNKLQDEIIWYQWLRVDHKYQKSGREYITKKTTKQQMKGIVSELLLEFEKQLKNFKIHVFNWYEQHRQYRACVTNLTNEEMIILCDFSENFDCKYSKEIQSMHFGASKNSITLHTGVIFGKECSTSFVTVSDDNCHEPHSIWAHLIPVIKEAKQINPEMKIIHFFSDGPSSQYRQKKNFFLLNYFTQKLKLTHTTWSFSEAGHGKNLADGVWGSVKRQLDKRILYGEDITNATDAHKILLRTMKSVKTFYYVSVDDVNNMKTLIPEGIRVVPGTMQLHQIVSTNINQIEHRILSCFCNGMRGLCRCHNPQIHILMTSRNYKMQEPSRAGVLESMTNNVSGMVVLPYREPSEQFPTGTNQVLVTAQVIRRPPASLSPESSETLVPNYTTQFLNSESIIEQIDISPKDSATADEQLIEIENILDFPFHSDKIILDTIDYLEPIKDPVMDIENIPANHLTEQVSVMVKTEYSVNDQVQATILPAKRVKILEPGDVYQPALTLPAKQAKILKPTAVYQSAFAKRLKTLQPPKKNRISSTPGKDRV